MSGINRTYIAPDPNNRRLLDEGMTWEKQLDMVDDLEKALEVGFDATQSMDWQLAFDELVLKFAPLLKSVSNILNSDGDINESIAINATALTLNFCLPICEPIPGLKNGCRLFDLVICCQRCRRNC